MFKDELCGAKWNKSVSADTIELTCHKGTLRVTGMVTVQFQAYRAWCKDCKKKHLVNRKDLTDAFKSFARNLEKVLEDE